MENPFKNIFIAIQILQIDFSILYNMGSWEMSANSYQFRFQNDEFKPIGTDYNSTMRNTEETEDRNYNFLTKKVKVMTGNVSGNEQKTKWTSIDSRELKTFKTFTRPFSWEVQKDIFI